MKKSYMLKLMGLVGSLMLTTALYASEETQADFGSLDTNQDGSISAEEATSDAQLSQNWSDIDADENGVIDQAEFSAFEVMRDGAPMAPEEPATDAQ
jgi:Ca2+-binding EF-hand superfamily protein